MKTIFKLLSIFIFLIFVSCSKDGDGGTSGNVVGKWAIIKASGIENGQEVGLEDWVNQPCGKDFIEFIDGGQFKQASYSNNNCSTPPATGTWAKVGNTIKISGGSTAVYEVVSVTSNSLKMKFKNPTLADVYEDIFYFERLN
jgi:hypothetical protein